MLKVTLGPEESGESKMKGCRVLKQQKRYRGFRRIQMVLVCVCVMVGLIVSLFDCLVVWFDCLLDWLLV